MCKGYENGVSTVLSFGSHMQSYLEEELEFSLAFNALDYTSLRDYVYNSYFAMVQLLKLNFIEIQV